MVRILSSLLLILLSFSVRAEVWELRITPDLTWENGDSMTLGQLDGYYIGCGRDLNAMNEWSMRLSWAGGTMLTDGTGVIRNDFVSGVWYCVARTIAINGQESGRSSPPFEFTASSGGNGPIPPPEGVRPRSPSIQGAPVI